MASVRLRGSTIVILHKFKAGALSTHNPRILFTIRCRAEALEALGRTSANTAHWLPNLLEARYPEVRFDWDRIVQQIELLMPHLPDLAEYHNSRLTTPFRADLTTFARRIMLTEPLDLNSSSEVITEHRYQLEFLQEIIKLRIGQTGSEFGRDNAFYWRNALPQDTVPHDVFELATECYSSGDFERAEAHYKLLIGCFPRFAEGYHRLGYIEYSRGRLDEAIQYYRTAIKIGRQALRHAEHHRFAHSTIGPVRAGLIALASTLIEVEEYQEAVAICADLEANFGATNDALALCAYIFLNTHRADLALKATAELLEAEPSKSFVAAFALFQLGRFAEARLHFIRASLNSPFAMRLLLRIRTRKPDGIVQVEDHNSGFWLLKLLSAYLESPHGRSSTRYFRKLVRHPHLRMRLREVETTRAELDTAPWEERSGRLQALRRLESMEFAQEVADMIGETAK